MTFKPHSTPSHIAIVGGGVAGLATAWQLKQTQPDLLIDVFERGSEQSYTAAADDSHRASLGESGARTMRLMGASGSLGQWNVRETLSMIQALEARTGETLFTPEASVFLGKPDPDPGYDKSKQSLVDAGVAFSELTAQQAKERWPNFYNTLADDARVLVEEPYDAVLNPTGAAGVIHQEALMKALQQELTKDGASFHFNAAIAAVESDAGKSDLIFQDGSALAFDHAVIAPGQWIGNLVDTQALNIETRLDRVVMARIDMKGLGLETAGFPFSKGYVPKGGEGSAYSFDADSSNGVIKFLPGATTRPVGSITELQEAVSEAEADKALTAAATRFGIDKETLRPHTQYIACAYTCPKLGERALISPLNENSTVIGLDSSGSARTIGGMGSIAAHLALGLPEPHTGAYAQFGLESHHQQNKLDALEITPNAAEIIGHVKQLAQAKAM